MPESQSNSPPGAQTAAPPAPAASSATAVGALPNPVKGAVQKPNVATPFAAPQAAIRPAVYGEPTLPWPAPEGGKLVKFKLNGKELEVPAGTNLIEAARGQGVSIPYYCYHPGLTPAGNCRMCLVEASNSKKPITACTTPVTDGLEIITDSDSVKKARAGVLELMLINHPLDCPICDKSGECMLQDHTFAHGKDRSRMVEPKELKHTKDLGKDIIIWGNRCIVCTRCVRFCEEIAGTGELCVVERADHSVVDVFDGYPLQNNLSGNVVDICPVGALISKDFLYQARVWFQKKTDSICTACSRGCNVEIQTKDNRIKRLVARHNPRVNDYWMCDHGRYDVDYVLGENRALGYRLGTARPADAAKVLVRALGEVARSRGPESLGVVASAFQTNEELFLARTLADALGIPRQNLAAWARPDGREEIFKSGFRISADKNPNRSGARKLLGADAFERLPGLVERVESGQVTGLLVFSDRPHFPFGSGDVESRLAQASAKLAALVVFELERGGAGLESAIVLPATAFSEKDGTMVNDSGRVQRLRPATDIPRGIRPELEILQDALVVLTKRDRVLAASGVFRELAPALGIAGSTYNDVGKLGISAGGGA
ncbi:MAG TPA: 2Fe-2S iron-sulfur cluster-binding protein [Planctomycetota bacterium]|nr:2Fe-2S iron-sulfur cluster-binding protein [Planctomycetota bacterium]